MKLFLSAIGLVMIFEGLPYFINPGGMKKMALIMSETDPKALRVGGFVLMVAGLALLYYFHAA